jgi:putative hydrolase of the HAD superfamily
MHPTAGVEMLLKTIGPRLQTVIFDLDGTLRYDQPAPDDFIYDYAVSLGVQDGPEPRRWGAQWAHYYWAQSKELFQDLEIFGEYSERFWINYIMRSLLVFNCPPDMARQLAPKIQRFMAEQYQPRDLVWPDVDATLKTLHLAGIRLGVLSNRQEPCHDYLEEIKLEGYFDLVLVAGEVSSWKPDAGIFINALQRLDANSAKTIYVGDNYYADVLGARNAGIEPVLFDHKCVFPQADCPVIRTIGELKALGEVAGRNLG